MTDLSKLSNDELLSLYNQHYSNNGLPSADDEEALQKKIDAASTPEGYYGGVQHITLRPEKAAPTTSFWQDVAANAQSGIQDIKDLANLDFQSIGEYKPTPKTEALSEKLLKGLGDDPSIANIVKTAASNIGDTNPSDFSGAWLEKFAENPAGKAVGALTGLNPVWNAASTAVSKYVNPAITDATGINPDNLALLEMVAGTIGLKGARNTPDPTVSLVKSIAETKPVQSFVANESGVPALLDNNGLSAKAIDKIYARANADAGSTAELKRLLNSYASSQDKSLVQSMGDRAANLAEGSAMFPSGAARASEFFNEQILNAPDRLKASASKTISATPNYYDTLDNIVASGQKEAAPVYKSAFKANQSLQSPLLDKILNTPEGKSALADAVRNMQNEMASVAKPDKELTALAKEASEIGLQNPVRGGVAKGLKLRTLDYVKKAMDSNINKAFRVGDNAEAGRIINLKNGLLSEVDRLDKSGLYKKARGVSGDYLSAKSAMEDGLNFLREDSEIVGRNYKDYTPAEKRAYKSGVVKSIRDYIDNKTDGRNVADIFGKPSLRKKLKAILNDKEYNKLLSDANAVDKMYKLRNRLVGNSRTQLRKIASEEFNDAGHELVQNIVDNGFKRTGIKYATNLLQRQFSGLSNKLAGEVADILYETDPKKKYQIVKSLTNLADKNEANAAAKLGVFYAVADKVAEAKNSAIFGSSQEQPSSRLKTVHQGATKDLSALSDAELIRQYNQLYGSVPSDIARDEGLRHSVYYDTTGHKTIGYGFNMDSKIANRVWKQAGIQKSFDDVYDGKQQITDSEANALGRVSVEIARSDAADVYPNFPKLSESRQAALTNLSYNLGKGSLSNLSAFNTAVNNGQWQKAVYALLTSKYAQNDPNRMRKIARGLLRGS